MQFPYLKHIYIQSLLCKLKTTSDHKHSSKAPFTSGSSAQKLTHIIGSVQAFQIWFAICQTLNPRVKEKKKEEKKNLQQHFKGSTILHGTTDFNGEKFSLLLLF